MYRNICFTKNNYNIEDIESICDFGFSYFVVGYEYGKENNTPHIQGYGEMKSRTRLTTIIKKLKGFHIEERRGTCVQASDYCKKEGNFVVFGEMNIKNQGKRNDLDKVRTDALENGMRSVTAKYNAQQIKIAEKFLTYNEEPREWETKVIWLWGPTGTGKSKLARELCNEDTYTKNVGSKWWDGYDGHENVIIDDFRPSWWDLTYMLALLDRYEMQVEVKGGMRQFKPKKIIVTSAFPPNECYKNTGEAINQLLRRVHEIKNLLPEVMLPEVEGGNTEPLLI